MEYQLPKEFAEKWVSALRSGEFKQTTQKYKWRGCYCAMGVAYCVNGYKVKSIKYSDSRPIPLGADLQHEILDLNDFKSKTFPQIADWIEANVQFI